MAANLPMKWEQIGVDESGMPLFNVTLPDGAEGEEPHLVITGNHSSGPVELPDGTTYDVTAGVIRVKSPEHAGLVSHLIGEQHEQRGLLGFGEHTEAQHICTDHCGELARPSTAADAYRAQQALLASGAAEAAASNGVAGITGFTNLHSASTGTTGANELGSTRQATAWTAATSGSPNPANSAALSYSLAASTTATHIGGWSLVSAGVFSVGFPLSPTVTTGTSAGTVTVAIGALVIGTT